MAVCEFCQTTLLKDAAAVRNLGKMSEVLEDYSPLQIGASGQFTGRSFSLIGRIQLKYPAGFWNEWYALFDDGTNGWLSDASGQFTMTFARSADGPLPLFDKLVPGRAFHFSGQSYAASDVRSARCTAGQGELPFQVGAGWEAKMADFRAGNRFLSLDYSDAGAVRVYSGQSVKLADLKPQLLRDLDQISDAAGRLRGKVGALKCPSCGAPVKCVPGFTMHLVCPSCQADVDTAGSVATVLAAGAVLEMVNFTLELGAEAVIDGARHTVLGAMRRADDESEWSEYLLYAPGRAFLWVIETSDGWQRAAVLDSWPDWDGAGHATLDGRHFTSGSGYTARVTFAAGSFNWRVSVGDTVRVTEFSSGPVRLAAEASDEELTWSRSVPLPLDQLRAWFGGHIDVDRQPHPKYMDMARRILIAFAVVNAIPLVFATGNAMPYALLGAAAICLPAYFLDRLDAQGK